MTQTPIPVPTQSNEDTLEWRKKVVAMIEKQNEFNKQLMNELVKMRLELLYEIKQAKDAGSGGGGLA